ncbi:MAG: A24 family peptidase [Pseudomonadota bacterium]
MITLSSVVHLIIIACYAGVLLGAAAQDMLWLKLPNRLTLALLLLYPAHVIASVAPVDWPMALVAAAVALVVGFFFFTMGWIGGGDAKLFAVGTLWAGPALFPEFLMATTLSGGVIALSMLVRRRFPTHLAAATGPHATDSPALDLRPQKDVPYGAAIGFGGLTVAVILMMQG